MNEYYYSVGRVRALEARMLTPAQLARLIAARDPEAAFSVLSETPYAENLAKLKHAFDFEELTELEFASLKDLMEHLAPENEIIKALMSGNLCQLRKICEESSSSLIKNMAYHKVDLYNLKALLRTQVLKKELKKFLLEPGFIDKDILLDLYQQPPQEVISRLSFTLYFPALSAGIEYYARTGSFFLLEKLMDDFIIKQLKKAKYLAGGLKPLVGFYLAKEAEIKTVRFILICKKNYIAAEKIKERIRASYA